jgi:uncharacterized membrane protein
MRRETTFVSEKHPLIVMAAAYQDVADAEADYEALEALYHEVVSSHDFDAAVVVRDENGEVKVVEEHAQSTRHGAAHGLDCGLAMGTACAIFPPARLPGGPAVGGGAGAAIGAVTGHMKGTIDDEDLAALGDGLGQGQAGLIIVYEVNMADQIAANMKSVNTVAISKRIDAYADRCGSVVATHDAKTTEV